MVEEQSTPMRGCQPGIESVRVKSQILMMSSVCQPVCLLSFDGAGEPKRDRRVQVDETRKVEKLPLSTHTALCGSSISEQVRSQPSN